MHVLEHGPHGYVAYDRHSTLYEVAFHTSLLTLDHGQVVRLYDVMDERLRAHRGRICPGAKLFHFGERTDAMRMVLCFNEMERMHAMLEEALMERAVQDVMGAA